MSRPSARLLCHCSADLHAERCSREKVDDWQRAAGGKFAGSARAWKAHLKQNLGIEDGIGTPQISRRTTCDGRNDHLPSLSNAGSIITCHHHRRCKHHQPARLLLQLCLVPADQRLEERRLSRFRAGIRSNNFQEGPSAMTETTTCHHRPPLQAPSSAIVGFPLALRASP